MANGQLLSIMGLYNYYPAIFDNLKVPKQMDKQVLINNLVMELAELELLYPSAELMRTAIGYWSDSRIHEWERVAEVLYKDYDPFVNIQRDERRTIHQTDGSTSSNSGTSSDNVNAWNDGMTPRTSSQSNISGSDTGELHRTETYHLEGDSAIRDAQDIVKLEIGIRSEYDLYSYIITEFKNRFCLLVY